MQKGNSKRSKDNVKVKVHPPDLSDVGFKSFPPPQPRSPDGSLRVTRFTRYQVHFKHGVYHMQKLTEFTRFTSEIFELFIICSLMYKISFICYCLRLLC